MNQTMRIICQIEDAERCIWVLYGLKKYQGSELRKNGAEWIRGIGCPGGFRLTDDMAINGINNGIKYIVNDLR